MSEKTCQNLPVIKTDRLVLRPVRMTDVAAIETLCGHDYEVARWLTGSEWPYVPGSALRFVSDLVQSDPLTNEAVFAVTFQGTFVGVAAIEGPGDLAEFPELPSVGYWIGGSFQGRSFATEAVIAALTWAFEAHSISKVGARAFHDNAASINLLTKLGFVEAGSEVRYAKILKQDVHNRVFLLDQKTLAEHAPPIRDRQPIG